MADAARCADRQSCRLRGSWAAAEGGSGAARDRAAEIGTSIVFDFAGNTPEDRAWVRSIFESVGAGHRLHVIVPSDELCKVRLRLRNETKPAGLYYGTVTEALFDEVTRYFVPPADGEKFEVSRCYAERD